MSHRVDAEDWMDLSIGRVEAARQLARKHEGRRAREELRQAVRCANRALMAIPAADAPIEKDWSTR